MYSPVHATAGELIATAIPNPTLAFLAGISSHYILDAIPHGDEELYHDEEWKTQHRYRRVIGINALDLACLIGLTLWAIQRPGVATSQLMLIDILGSILPDF